MRKTLPRKSRKTSVSEGPNSHQLAEAIFKAIPELSEVLSQADVELAIEDRGWIGTGMGQLGGADLLPHTRKILIQKSRLAWRTDPLAKQAVRVWTTYCLGNGLSYEADDKKVNDEIDAFFTSPVNERLLNPAGQQCLSNQLLVDGDIFFTMFQGDVPKLRTIDPAQIDGIVTDPDDDQTVWCYRRKTSKDETLYYADWALDEETQTKVDGSKDSADQNRTIKLERDKDGEGEVIPVYHLAFDRFGKFGNGLLICSLNWSREHARFMVSRVAIAQALAKFASKLTVKGGQAAVNAAAARIQSSLTTSGLNGPGYEKNPSPAPGSTFLQNAGIDLQATPRTTGASDAKTDSDNLKLMVSAGTGIMLHYFGDPSTGNLATSTAMELPMLKAFTSYQELWRGAYRRILSIARKEPIDKKPAPITIELPPILDEDLQKLGSFLTPLTTAFPETKIPEILRTFLIALGVENIDDVLDEVEAQREKIDAQNLKDAATAHNNALALATAKPAAPAPAAGAPQVELTKESRETLDTIAELFREVMAT